MFLDPLEMVGKRAFMVSVWPKPMACGCRSVSVIWPRSVEMPDHVGTAVLSPAYTASRNVACVKGMPRLSIEEATRALGDAAGEVRG